MKTDVKTRIFFYEVHPLMILGIEALIQNDKQLALCGSSGKHDNLTEQIASAQPDQVILDLALYTREGLDFIAKLREGFPELGIIILSVHTERDYIDKALKAGANSYVLKTEEPECILDAIRSTASGQSYISKRVRQSDKPPIPPTDSPINLLSKQQFRILQLIGKGKTIRVISDDLNLPPTTVEAETETIRKKLDLSTPVELLQFAFHWVHHEGGFS